MSYLSPISIKVEEHVEPLPYGITVTIDAPIAFLVPRPMEKGGFLGLSKRAPDPPSMFVERRIPVALHFRFSEGILERELLPLPFDEDTGVYTILHAFNGNIDPIIPLNALARFELVSGDEWSGFEPETVVCLQHPNTGKVIQTAPPMWDIASVNSTNGERVVAIRTHAKKDDAFHTLNRINQLVAYGHNIATMISKDHSEEDIAELSAWCRENPMRFKAT